MQQDEAPAPEVTSATVQATRSVESTSPTAAAAVTPPRRTRRPQVSEPLPQRLTPKMQNAIRIFSTGISAKESSQRSGVALRYFKRVINSPIGDIYLKTLQTRVETAFIDKAAAVVASDKKLSIGQATVQNEIDEAVLESVQELRSIVKTSKSDQARALAAKELLDLAQAKKRYMESLSGKETDVELTGEDIKAYATATNDLRALHAKGSLEVLGDELKPPAESDIVRTIEAAVDPEVIAEAVAAIDQVMPEGRVAEVDEAESARPDGRLISSNHTAPVAGHGDTAVNDPLGDLHE